MKNSKEYAVKIADFFEEIKSSKKVIKPLEYKDKIDVLILGILNEFLDKEAVAEMYEKISNQFVDWNDLRVSRDEEIEEVLGGFNQVHLKIAKALKETLQIIFETYDMISLDELDELGKREIKQKLCEMEKFSLFVISYFMHNVYESHSLAVNENMAEYLKRNDLVHPNSTIEDITGFLERQVLAQDLDEFYYGLRDLAEKPVEKAEAIKTTKKTVAKTTKKKATTKKPAAKKTTKKKTTKKS